MKKLPVIIVSICMFLTVSAQEADTKIGELINKSDWFALEEAYSQSKDSMQAKFLKLLAEVMIGYNFNRPESALQKIGELLSDHQSEIGFDNACNLVILASVIDKQCGNYAEAADRIKNVSDQLKSAGVDMDFSPYEKLYAEYDELRDYPACHVLRPDKDIEVPVAIKPVTFLKPVDGKKSRGFYIDIPVTIHDKVYPFIFDTGAASTYMSERFAREAGVKIMKDSLLINQGLMGEGYGMQGYLDSLQVGEIVFRNILVTIGKPQAIDSIVAIDAVLGMDFMKRIEEIQICVKENKIIFPARPTPLPQTGRNLLLMEGNKPVLKAYSNNDRLLFFFDTGNNKTDLFYSYYEKYKSEIGRVARTDTLTTGGFGFVRTERMLRLPSVSFKIGEAYAEMKDIYVHPVADNSQTQEDGNLGMDLIKLFDKTTINLRDMFVEFE